MGPIEKNGLLVNDTEVTTFILLGFPAPTKLQLFYISFFLIIYILTVVTNLLIIIMIQLHTDLHSLYFFLSNFAVLDTWCSISVIPKTLSYLITQNKEISHAVCLAQLSFVHSIVPTEFFLLTAMAYNRYLVICHALQYPTLINDEICLYLADVSRMSGFFTCWIVTIPTALLNYYGHNLINLFFCNYITLVRLSCFNATASETVFLSLALVVMLSSPISTTFSYSNIIKTILGIPSNPGCQKAFSTCAAYSTIVLIFYGTVIVMYVRPRASYFSDKAKIIPLFHSIITPLLNPLICSLRNRDFKGALKKVHGKIHKFFSL